MMNRMDWTRFARQWLADDPGLAIFTGRQRDVIRLIADGRSMDEVSQIIGIRPGVVRKHLAETRLRVEIERVRAQRPKG